MDQAAQMLQLAQGALDDARTRIGTNQALARVLSTDAERYISDGLLRIERTRRFLTLARTKSVSGRWPQVATRQREDVEAELDAALRMLEEAEQQMRPLRDKIESNPPLAEAIAADAALVTSRALRRVERVVRTLTEGGIGRE